MDLKDCERLSSDDEDSPIDAAALGTMLLNMCKKKKRKRIPVKPGDTRTRVLVGDPLLTTPPLTMTPDHRERIYGPRPISDLGRTRYPPPGVSPSRVDYGSSYESMGYSPLPGRYDGPPPEGYPPPQEGGPHPPLGRENPLRSQLLTPKVPSAETQFFDSHVTNRCELEFVIQLSDSEFKSLVKSADSITQETVTKLDSESAPLRFKILNSRLPPAVKKNAISRISNMTSYMGGDAKYIQWVESAIKIPLGIFAEPPSSDISISSKVIETSKSLDKCIYGHDTTKKDLLKRLASNSPPSPLLLHGPPGVGKTRLVRKALANTSHRPFVEIPLGGATNADFLRGSLFVYEGSGPGRIAQGLVSGGVMNPVIFLDEVDKVSNTPHGQEIFAILIQLVDNSQNECFEDRYLSEIPLDVSKCHFVFACNDINKIDPVLLDRLDVVNVEGYSKIDKTKILQNHLLEEICDELKIDKSSFDFTDEAFTELVNRTEEEKGVRRLREILRHVLQSVAAARKVSGQPDSKDAMEVLGVADSLKDVVGGECIPSTVMVSGKIVCDILNKRSPRLEGRQRDVMMYT